MSFHVALRNKHSENTAVYGESSDRLDLCYKGQSIHLPEGSKPYIASLSHAVSFIYSLVTCSLLGRSDSWQKQLASLCLPSLCLQVLQRFICI